MIKILIKFLCILIFYNNKTTVTRKLLQHIVKFMKNNFILCRNEPVSYQPKWLQKEKMQKVKRRQNPHHPTSIFFWQEGREEGKG